MRGKQYSLEVKERALAALAVSNNIDALSREMGIPASTLRKWRKEVSDETEFAELRAKKRADFVDLAWETIRDALELGARRVKRAIEKEEELDEILEEAEDKLTGVQREAALSKIRTLQIQNLREISTYIGTMYDKAALAAGEETERAEVRITMSGELEEFSK